MERKKGVIWSYLLMFAEMLSSLLFTPFLIRSFGQAEYGVYSLVASMTAYLALLDLGVGNAIVRYMAKYRVLKETAKQKNLLAVTISFYALIGVIAIIIGIILRNNIDSIFGKGLNEIQLNRANKMFSITMLNMAVTFLIAPFDKTIIAFEKFVVHKLMAIIKIIIRISVSIIVLSLGGKGIAIVTVNFSLTICFGIISSLYVLFKLKVIPMFKNMDFIFVKEIISYSIFIFIQMIATQINSMTAQILIGALVKSSAVILGIYAVGVQINQYFQSIASSINGVLMPGVVKLVESNATTEDLLLEMVKIGRLLLLFLGIIWSVFLVFGKHFIILWAGENNSSAYYVACILITPMLITLVQSIGTQILWAKNKHQTQAYLKIGVAVLNIVLTIFLINWNPLMGACLGTAISIFIGDIVVMNIVFSKDIGISMKKYYKKLFNGILPGLFFSIVSGLIVKLIFPYYGWLTFCVGCAFMVLIYVSYIYFKGANNYERTLINNLLNKIFKGAKRYVQK